MQHGRRFSVIWPAGHALHGGGAAALAVVGFCVLAVVWTWPLATRIATCIPGPPGDSYYFVWLVDWTAKAVFELQRLPLWVPHLNYPEGWNLAYNEMAPAMTGMALPLTVWGGPILGYSSVMLLSFVLSGLGVYLWVRRLSADRAAAFVAGAVFALAPYRINHVQGHLNLAGTQWLPFYFMSLHDWLQGVGRRQSLLLAAVFLGLVGCTSMYYLYMTLLLSLVYVVACWWQRRRRPGLPPAWPRRLGLLLLAALPAIALGAAPHLQAADQMQPTAFEEARFWSASPSDFFTPFPAHPVLGAWARTHWDAQRAWESTIYVGALALLLAGMALARRRCWPAGVVPILTCVGLAAAVLALGTDLHWLGQGVTLSVPAWLQRWYPHARAPFALPGYLLFRFLPWYDRMRVWMRYGVFVNLCVSVLAGLGLAWLLGRMGRRLRAWVALGVLALCLIDFYPGALPVTRIRPRAVDVWLAAQRGQGAVAEFPLERSTLPTLTYYTSVHNKPLITGFFAACEPPQFRRIRPVLAGFPDGESVDLLRQLGVQWVIVDASHFPGFQEAQGELAALGLRPAFAAERYHVYELLAE